MAERNTVCVSNPLPIGEIRWHIWVTGRYTGLRFCWHRRCNPARYSVHGAAKGCQHL